MANTIVDWANDGTIPQSKTSGNWTPSQFNAGKFHFVTTFAAASSGSPWRPASLTYWGILTTNEANGSAMWLEWDPGTSKHRMLFVASDGSTFLAAMEFTWGASSAVGYTVDQSSATAGASTMTIAGASTGNATSSGWTRASVFSGANLYFGVWGAGGFQLPAGSTTTSDIDDATVTTYSRILAIDVAVAITSAGVRTLARNAAIDVALAFVTSAARTLARNAAVDVAVAFTSSAVRTLTRSAAIDVAVAFTSSATIDAGAYSRSLAIDVAVAFTSDAARTLARSAAVDVAVAFTAAAARDFARSAAVDVAIGFTSSATLSGTYSRTAAIDIATAFTSSATRTFTRSAAVDVAIGFTSAATITGAATFGPGQNTSAFSTYGHSASTLVAPKNGTDADGRTGTAINTRASGSSFLLFGARPASANSAPTDTTGGSDLLGTGASATGNTFSVLSTNAFNDPWTAWESLMAVCVGGAGGSNHRFILPSVASDEDTLFAQEIELGHVLVDWATGYTLSGETQISPAVSCTGPAEVFVFWTGDSATSGAEGSAWTVTANNQGPAVGSEWQVQDSRTINHNDGWIPGKLWRRRYEAATSGIQLSLASLSPTQGARWYVAVFQEYNYYSRTAAINVALSFVTAASVERVRTAAINVAVAFTASAIRTFARSAAVDVATVITSSAVRTFARSAAIDVAVVVASAAARTLARSAAIDIAFAFGSSATLVHGRSLAVDTLIAFSSAATLAANPQRSASIDVAIGFTSSAVRTLARSAAVNANVEIAASGNRTFARSAAVAVAVGFSSAATVDGATSTGRRRGGIVGGLADEQAPPIVGDVIDVEWYD